LTKLPLRLRIGRPLLRDVFVTYLSSIVGGVLQLGTLIILARGLGPAGLGGVVVATTVSGLIAGAVEFGIGPTLIRFHPNSQPLGQTEWDALQRFLLRLIAALAGLVAFAGIGSAIGMRLAGSASASTLSVLTAFFCGSLLTLSAYFQNYLVAERRFTKLAWLSCLVPTIRLAASLVLLALGALTIETTLAAYVIAVAGLCVVSWQFLPRPLTRTRASASQQRRARALAVHYMRWMVLGRVFAALHGRIDAPLLALMVGRSAAGVFGAANQVVTAIQLLASALGQVSFPHILARRTSLSPRDVLRRWLPWLPVIVVVCTAIGVGGAFVLPLALGSGYAKVGNIFLILCFAYGLVVWLQPIGALLNAHDRAGVNAVLTVIQVLMTLILDVVFIPRFGPLGPSVALAMTMILMALLTLFVVERSLTGARAATFFPAAE